jgi:hypothetical protein
VRKDSIGWNDEQKTRRMNILNTSFDRFVEQHYQSVYQVAADLVLDPLAAARVTERVFRHARDLMSRTGELASTRRTLLKIAVLESAADSLRMATA